MSGHAFDRFYYDADNWKLGVIYFCREDRRILVRRRGFCHGWTFNFARPLALPFLGLIIVLVLGGAELARRFL